MYMKMAKKWIALLMAALMLLSAAAFAEEAAVEAQPEWWNILLLGGDSRSLESYDRTDTMIILSVNREESRMKMTSIMRDVWVQYSEKSFEKINAANVFGGPELAMKVVNENFGTDIEHYILVNMNGLVELIDMIGGVTVEVSESEREHTNKIAQSFLNETAGYDGKSTLDKSGNVHLNGLLAVAYLRNRSTDNDFGRVMRQQKVLLAAAQQAQESDVDALMELADDFAQRIQTNMTTDQLKEIAMAGLVTDIETVEQFRIPVDGTFEDGTFNGTWMIRPNFEKNEALLHDFIYAAEQE